MHQEATSIESLPDEVIWKIFEQCRNRDKKKLALTNRRFLRIYRYCSPVSFVLGAKTSATKRKNLTFIEVLEILLNAKYTFFPKILLRGIEFDFYTSIDLVRVPLLDPFVNRCAEISIACEGVTSIYVENCQITPSSIRLLRVLFPNLSRFTIDLKKTNILNDSGPWPELFSQIERVNLINYDGFDTKTIRLFLPARIDNLQVELRKFKCLETDKSNHELVKYPPHFKISRECLCAPVIKAINEFRVGECNISRLTVKPIQVRVI